MSKHTAGPWNASVTSADQGLIIAENTGVNIAVAYYPRDAALIAAAPELLEALQYVNTYWGAPFDHAAKRAIPEKVRAAIAKATGA